MLKPAEKQHEVNKLAKKQTDEELLKIKPLCKFHYTCLFLQKIESVILRKCSI